MDNVTPSNLEKTPTVKPLEERMEEKKVSLEKARSETRLQLNGIENQLFLIEQLLNPEPPPAPTDRKEPPDGHM